MLLRLNGQYDLKFLSTVALFTILLCILSFWSYDKEILLITLPAAILTLWGCMILLGHLLSPFYLQRKIIRLVKKNGGRIEYREIVDYFRSISREHRQSGDVVAGLLEELERKERVKTVGGIVHLIRDNG